MNTLADVARAELLSVYGAPATSDGYPDERTIRKITRLEARIVEQNIALANMRDTIASLSRRLSG